MSRLLPSAFDLERLQRTLQQRDALACQPLTPVSRLHTLDSDILGQLEDTLKPLRTLALPADWPAELRLLGQPLARFFIAELAEQEPLWRADQQVYLTQLWLTLHDQPAEALFEDLEVREREVPRLDRVLAHLQCAFALPPLPWQHHSLMFCYRWLQNMLMLPWLRDMSWREKALQQHGYDKALSMLNTLLSDPSHLQTLDTSQREWLKGCRALDDATLIQLQPLAFLHDSHLTLSSDLHNVTDTCYGINLHSLRQMPILIASLLEASTPVQALYWRTALWLMQTAETLPTSLIRLFAEEDIAQLQGSCKRFENELRLWAASVKVQSNQLQLAGAAVTDEAAMQSLWQHGLQGHRMALAHYWNQQHDGHQYHHPCHLWGGLS
ncbi:hypothetical protein QCD60_10245 [Pokkaliibacter sp. MBI-7]|uniref:hypothetical protein n=1 Tax=Pokkaliibacter sp. MBI-7 TaxID=3040600 RepID=UPI00244A9C9C|nr:hypothetical protein [Pokkaliibacter sp. MBI-7]MDH2432946.1 hypothetical protein [Pokkaliibacter sp. MBI-7]